MTPRAATSAWSSQSGLRSRWASAIRSVVAPAATQQVDDLVGRRPDLGVDEDRRAGRGGRARDRLEPAPLGAADVVIGRTTLDRAGPRRVERQRRVEPVARVHPDREIRDDPVAQLLDGRLVDPRIGGVVRVAVEAARGDDREPGRLADRAQAGRVPPEADRRHLHEGADPAREAVAGLLDRALDVGEALAGHPGRVDQEVVVRVDDAERGGVARAGDGDDLGLGHATSSAPDGSRRAQRSKVYRRGIVDRWGHTRVADRLIDPARGRDDRRWTCLLPSRPRCATPSSAPDAAPSPASPRPRSSCSRWCSSALLPLSGHVAAATTFSRNLFVAKGFVYQDPYYTACTAAVRDAHAQHGRLPRHGRLRLPLEAVHGQEVVEPGPAPRHDLDPRVRAAQRHAPLVARPAPTPTAGGTRSTTTAGARPR